MIELLVLDVDGCLSDGKITYTSSGEELKSFNVKDGLGIATWIKLGKKVAIITGRKSSIVQKRAKELNITYLYQGINNKKEILEEILEKENLAWNNVAGIGDDLNDVSMLRMMEKSYTPKNGAISSYVNQVLSKNGGEGAVREMIDKIVIDEGLKEEFDKLWL